MDKGDLKVIPRGYGGDHEGRRAAYWAFVSLTEGLHLNPKAKKTLVCLWTVVVYNCTIMIQVAWAAEEKHLR